MSIKVGSYVRYKGVVSIVTSIKDGKAKIMNPLKSQVKLNVLLTNLEDTGKCAAVVTYNKRDYLVTKYHIIISLTSEKIMKWGNESGERKMIMESYHSQLL